MNDRLYDLASSAKPGRVLVIGDVILDRYIEGSVERISPEAPVEVLEVSGEYEVLGGGANVAANVAALGGKASIVGVVGSDLYSNTIRSLLKKWGIKPGGLVIDKSRTTTIKTRLMALRQQMLRVDRESRLDVSSETGRRILEKIETEAGRCDGVIVSDYGKGALPSWLLKELFAICKKKDLKVIVDPKGADYSRYKGTYMITPNRNEAAMAAGMQISVEKDYDKAARKIFKMTGASRLVITRGAEGMSVYEGPGRGRRLAAEALEVFDVSGAGDTVIAALGVFLFAGAGLDDSAALANVAASIEVGHVGAWPVDREEILRKLGNERHGAGKIMNLRQAASYAGRIRAQGKKVVFTNGCFDLLHVGHVKLLKQARTMGHSLIIGVNSDGSIRRLKGKNQPLLCEGDRLEMLSALDCVDAIVIFSDDTPLKLIKAVKPDVLVKGGDYKVSQVVGREEVESNAGLVKIIPLVDGKSTTKLIDSILEKHCK